jgi:poly(hydroxyalkanoate) depolymerase family esterase
MSDRFWPRVRAYFARWLRREAPAPGRFVAGSKFAWNGWLRGAPWVWPAREYLVYVPRGHSRWKRRPLLVLLHGCRQTPEAIATGTRIAALADHHGWLVLLPRQAASANPWSCWNWFDRRTAAGGGEAAIVAAQVRAVRRAYRAHPRRIFAAGMSAGGALAAALGVQRPDLFAGIFVHSGIACGAASGPLAALDVLLHGADAPCERLAAAARQRARGVVPPLVAIQGGDDEVVAAINATQLVRQYLVLHGRLEPDAAPSAVLPPPDASAAERLADGRVVTTSDYRAGGGVAVRLIGVEGLGHAWSGGDATLPYNAAQPPDATGLLGEFVVAQVRRQRRLRIGRTP